MSLEEALEMISCLGEVPVLTYVKVSLAPIRLMRLVKRLSECRKSSLRLLPLLYSDAEVT